MIEFRLWLEFEEDDSSNWETENEFANIQVDLLDGRHYCINVWTYKYLETAITDDQKSGENLAGLYLKPPDLFVKEMTRLCLEQVVSDLLKQGNLEDILNTRVIMKTDLKD